MENLNTYIPVIYMAFQEEIEIRPFNLSFTFNIEDNE